MADLNAWLVEELAQSRAVGRIPAFNISATLATTIHQVNATGMIANSYNNGQEFLDFIDGIGMQFHVFNHAKVAVMNGAEYEVLDAQQKFILSQIMDEVLGEDTLICNVLSALQKYLIGPISVFQQYDLLTGIHALSAGHHALVPNFGLPPGWTWAQLPHTPSPYLHVDQCQEFDLPPEITEETEKPAERIPRPPNPFIIYRAAHHKGIADANPDASNNEISKMIGRQWQSEPENVRETYRKKAAGIKEAFMAQHPNYKYSPRKSCEVKRRAKKGVAAARISALTRVVTPAPVPAPAPAPPTAPITSQAQAQAPIQVSTQAAVHYQSPAKTPLRSSARLVHLAASEANMEV